jgi:hypothetical protein
MGLVFYIMWSADSGVVDRHMAQAALADPLRPASTQDVRPPDFTYNLKILMGWFQITTSLLSVMAVSWPAAYASFMSNFNVVNFSFIPVWFFVVKDVLYCCCTLPRFCDSPVISAGLVLLTLLYLWLRGS